MSELAGHEDGSPYDGAAVLGAMLATAFFPLISLIAALLLQSGQSDPVKRGQLRTWAWISAGWIAVQVIIAVAIVIAIASTASGFHP